MRFTLTLLTATMLITGYSIAAPSDGKWISLDGQPVASGNPVEADGHVHKINAPAICLLPSKAATPRGTVLLFPGGGYGVLAIGIEGYPSAAFLNTCGYDVAMLEYHVSSGDKTRDMALEDSLKAWHLIKSKGEALGLHGGRYGIMGYSAGGHLAARTTQALAASPENDQPDNVILMYPAYLDECAKDSVWPLVLPPAHPKGRLFTVIASNDQERWVKSSGIYSKVWTGSDAYAIYHLLPDGGHGFGLGERTTTGAPKTVPTLLKDFLDAKPAPTPTSNPAAISTPPSGQDARHAAKVAAVKKEKFDLLMIGDSITHNFENPAFQSVWQQYYAPRHALNLGYSGYRTENIIWNLANGELENQSPKVVTLMAGTNNVDEKNYPTRHTAGQVAGGIKAIVDLLRRKLPDAKIIVLRPFPGSYDGPLPTSHRMILERAGDIIKTYADGQHVFYCDVNANFLNPDGSINHDLMPDYLHPNGKGALLWANAMEPLMCQLMGDKNRSNTAVIPVPKLEDDSYDWMARHKAVLEVKDAIHPDLVFIGDSITHAWGGAPASPNWNRGEKVLHSAFPNHHILNLGFGWDRTQNVLWRLEHGEFDNLQPKTVVINIGTNNTSETPHARQNTPEEITQGVDTICSRILDKAPQTNLILMAVFPREQNPENPRRLQINRINQLLAQLAKQRGITFLDIGAKFLNPDGTIPPALMGDFCHPTEKGYQIWADALLPILKP